MNVLYTLLWKKGPFGGGAGTALCIILALGIFFSGFWMAATWTQILGLIMTLGIAPILAIGTMIIVLRGIYLENVHRLNQRCPQ